MASNDSPDSEFDQEMERILREYFDSEGPALSASNDPWPWLESRMEEPAVTSFFSRLLGLLGILNPMREGRLSPAFAVASVAVVAVAVAAVVWAVSGNGAAESPDSLAGAPATEAPASTSLPTILAAAPTAAAMPTQEEVINIAGAQATAAPQALAPNEQEDAFILMEPEAGDATNAPRQALSQDSAAMPQVGGGSLSPRRADSVPPVGGIPEGTTFRDYQRQPFVAASEDNVSTFSLDTDRTSYHLALSWALSGYEIDPDSVRAEEWLNAFDYQYDPPSGRDEFAVTGHLYPHPLDEKKRLAHIAFQAPELVDNTPLNVTLVLDASGSMAKGNRVAIARQAAESIRQSLRPNDRIAVVHFTENVIRQFTVEHSSPDERRVRDSISWLQPHGSTNVQAGLDLGVRLADDAREQRPDAYNYVILMSDGVANVDATDPFAILETAYDPNSRNPLRLITIGVGINNYNDLLLEQLAQHGNGWYRYLDSPEQARVTFSGENWLALSIPFADQTRAQVTWNTGTVERWRIIGYENRVTADEDFTQDRKGFAELYSGVATTVLYELELTESAQSLASVPFGRVELRWVDPATGDSRSQTQSLSGRPGAGFQGQDGSLAHFGAIVALTADLYGGLPNYPEHTYHEIHSDLSTLQIQLRSLSGDLGTLDAYHDFMFLLEHITTDLEEHLPPSPPSGYSR